MQPVVLTTPRFTLSAPTASDIDAVFAACQDAQLQRFVPVPVPYERAHAEGFVIDLVPEWWRDDVEYVFGIRREPDAPLMGVVAWQRKRRYVGFWLGREYRGEGVMTEAVRGVLDWAFSHEGVDELRWEATAGNLGSALVAHRTGFRWDGTGRISHVRPGQEEGGWRAVLRREHLGTVQPRAEWPVLA